MPIKNKRWTITQSSLDYMEGRYTEKRIIELDQRMVVPTGSFGYSPISTRISWGIVNEGGSAKIVPVTELSTKLPFVSITPEYATQGVVAIANGVLLSQAEIYEVESARFHNMIPPLNVLAEKSNVSRKFIRKEEFNLVFKGNSDYGIKGLFDDSYYNGTGLGYKEDVAASGSGGTAVEQRKWVNKTPILIIDDILAGWAKITELGLFQPTHMALPKSLQATLLKPNTTNGGFANALEYITSKIGLPKENIMFSVGMQTPYNGDTVNYFMLYEKDSENFRTVVPQEITRTPTKIDQFGTTDFYVYQTCSGVQMKRPAAIYIGKGV